MNFGLDDDTVKERTKKRGVEGPISPQHFKELLSIYARSLLKSSRPKCSRFPGDVSEYIFKEWKFGVQYIPSCFFTVFSMFFLFSTSSSLCMKGFPTLYLQPCLLTLSTIILLYPSYSDNQSVIMDDPQISGSLSLLNSRHRSNHNALSSSQWQRSSIHDSNNSATLLQATIPIFTDIAPSIPTLQPKSPTFLSQWHLCRSMTILCMLPFTPPSSSPRNALEFPLAWRLTFSLIFQGLAQIPSYLGTFLTLLPCSFLSL